MDKPSWSTSMVNWKSSQKAFCKQCQERFLLWTWQDRQDSLVACSSSYKSHSSSCINKKNRSTTSPPPEQQPINSLVDTSHWAVSFKVLASGTNIPLFVSPPGTVYQVHITSLCSKWTQQHITQYQNSSTVLMYTWSHFASQIARDNPNRIWVGAIVHNPTSPLLTPSTCTCSLSPVIPLSQSCPFLSNGGRQAMREWGNTDPATFEHGHSMHPNE